MRKLGGPLVYRGSSGSEIEPCGRRDTNRTALDFQLKHSIFSVLDALENMNSNQDSSLDMAASKITTCYQEPSVFWQLERLLPAIIVLQEI